MTSHVVDIGLLAISNLLRETINIFIKNGPNLILLSLMQIVPAKVAGNMS